jgi:sigma-B regulation protein RsbU (phosphoserine phosphatase)
MKRPGSKVGRVSPKDESAQQSVVFDRYLVNNLLENTSDNIYFKDLQSRFLRGSKSLTRWLGLSDPAEAIGKTDFDFFSEEHARQAYADEQEIIRTGNPIVGKIEKETWPDGSVTWVSTTKLPLRDEAGKVIGTFGISRDVTAQKLAEERAAQYARELQERNRQMEIDLQMARELQQAMLPQQYPTFPPTVNATKSALQFHHRYRPSETLGGDFFLVFALSDTKAGVLICDVMGHGVRAALVTAMLGALAEELTPIAHDPGQFLSGLNRGLLATLQRTDVPTFATAFYAVVDATAGVVRYACAGHPSAVHVGRKTGAVELLRAETGGIGPALGLFEQPVYTVGQRELQPDDLLLLYTDGVYEVEGPNDEFFGAPRFVEAVRRRAKLPVEKLFDEVVGELEDYAVRREFSDDVCLFAVEVRRLLR